jgi:lysophospholipase L1-like esterase
MIHRKKFLLIILLLSFLLNVIFIIRIVKNRMHYAKKSRLHQEMVKKDHSKRLFTKLSEEISKEYNNTKRGIKLPLQKNDIVFVGNSITEGFPLSELFNSVRIKNRGIGGDNSFDILYRIDDILKYQPKSIFLMVGINDIHQRLPEEITMTNISQILKKIKETNTTIYIQSILPTSDSAINVIVRKYNQRLKKLAKNEQNKFIDLYPKFISRNKIADSLTYDGLHLTTQGYKIWKSEIYQFVK